MARAAAAADAWDKAAEHARRAGDEDERNEILSWVASSMFFGPTPVPEGIRRCEEIRAEVVGNPGSEAWALRSLAGLHAMVGRFELARTLLAEANGIFEELGQTLILLGFGYRRDRRAPGRRSRLPPKGASVAGYLALEKMGDRAFRPTTAAYLAEALYAQGRDEDAGRSRRSASSSPPGTTSSRRSSGEESGRRSMAGQGRDRRGRRPRAGGGDDQRVDRLPQHPRRRSRRSRPRSIGERAAWTRRAQLSRRALLSTRRRATASPSSRRGRT